LAYGRALAGFAARAKGNLGGRQKSYAPETVTAVLSLRALGPMSMGHIAQGLQYLAED
jgi:hypothetical protein